MRLARSLFAALLVATAVSAHPFPHPALYAASNGSGWPFINAGGSINSGVCKKVSRWPMMTLNITPFADTRPDVTTLIRGYNPNARILWYDTLVERFFFATTGTHWAQEWSALDSFKGWYMASDGTAFPNGDASNIRWTNLANMATTDTLASLISNRVALAPPVNGVFLDFANGAVAWMHSTTGKLIDFKHAGFLTGRQVDSAGTANLTRLTRTLRARGLVVGNGTTDDAVKRDEWDGDMFEGWPWARGGFEASMAAYLAAPRSSWVKVECRSTPYSADWNRAWRFALGCASMGEGYGYCGPDRDLAATGPTYLEDWPDEAAVKILFSGGYADTSGFNTGWLGESVNAATRTPGGGWQRLFPHGAVLLNGTNSPIVFDMVVNRYRRIYGFRDHTVNTGVGGRRFTVPANDALFIVRGTP
jgi:hypothetical protein